MDFYKRKLNLSDGLDLVALNTPCTEELKSAITSIVRTKPRNKESIKIQLIEKVTKANYWSSCKTACVFLTYEIAQNFYKEIRQSQQHMYYLAVRDILVVDNVCFIYQTKLKIKRLIANYMMENLKNQPIYNFTFAGITKDITDVIDNQQSDIYYELIWDSNKEKKSNLFVKEDQDDYKISNNYITRKKLKFEDEEYKALLDLQLD